MREARKRLLIFVMGWVEGSEEYLENVIGQAKRPEEWKKTTPSHPPAVANNGRRTHLQNNWRNSFSPKQEKNQRSLTFFDRP